MAKSIGPIAMLECKIHGITDHRVQTVGSWTGWRCKECQRDYYNERRKSLKLKALGYKGGVCSMCGLESEYTEIYDFHHRDPLGKEFAIGTMLAHPWSRIKEELDKCDLLCSNCHRILHSELRKKG